MNNVGYRIIDLTYAMPQTGFPVNGDTVKLTELQQEELTSLSGNEILFAYISTGTFNCTFVPNVYRAGTALMLSFTKGDILYALAYTDSSKSLTWTVKQVSTTS